MNKYEVIIGIEVHLELNTVTKMFSSSPISFNARPNTMVNEIDLGYPGALPIVNEQGVVKAIQLAKALEMEIDPLLRFDRKNYFYPDLPKGFQITQQFHPLGRNGKLVIEDETGKSFNVMIERIHLEEDTAKSIHQDNVTLLDYNRAGIGLIEIVTKPCLKTAYQVAKYINMLRLVALSLNISDAKMEEGSLRVDVNLSLKHVNDMFLGTKVEIKNLNSVNNVVKAIEYEINEQVACLDNGLVVKQATKRFDEKSQKTVVMRLKSDTIDYKYFPEPNLPPIKLSDDFINNIFIPELPWAQKARYEADGIDNQFIKQLLNSQDKAQFFDQIDFAHKNDGAKIFFGEIVALANRENKLVSELKIDPKQFSYALKLFKNQIISLQHLKKIVPKLIYNNQTVDEIIEQLDLVQIDDKAQLSAIIKEIIEQNYDFVIKNKHLPQRVIKFILGQVMKKTNGKANPQIASDIAKKLTEK